MSKRKLLYVVDDDPFINQLIVKRFNSDDYLVEAFEYGEDCLKAMDNNPDLIILDYYFFKSGEKVLNGLEIFEKIRDMNNEVPVIILSGQDRGDIVLELARKGINDYIIKDNSLISNLEAAMNDILGSDI
ncbi:MAG: response regulator [Bacteroidales bacterium]|nr:response regulator [Bacteroidales bacterium]